jgi:integrase
VLALLRVIEKRDAKETARRVRQRMSAVFLYAISSGRAENDPAAVVKGAMAPMKKGKQPAIIDLEKAREMLAKAEAEPAHPVTKLALRILALTAVRPGTLATTPWTEWADLDTAEPLWQIPAERMKLRLQHKDDEARDHLVPLSRQAVEAIAALRTISGRGPVAFPNTRHAHKPMSENAMGYLLNRAGYHHKHVPHGWRATFSSVMNERFPADKPVIDLMLAHTPKDKVEGAYNRALHLTRRRELAQLWADLILEGARPATDLLIGPRR